MQVNDAESEVCCRQCRRCSRHNKITRANRTLSSSEMIAKGRRPPPPRLFQTIKSSCDHYNCGRSQDHQQPAPTTARAEQQLRRTTKTQSRKSPATRTTNISRARTICWSTLLILLASAVAATLLAQCQGSSLTAVGDTAVAAAARVRRSPAAILMEMQQRVSGSKSEPPSRPSQDWSKQRPYFGPDMARNVSVELGKTAYLTCKVYELGDKTVSWLRPRENEILTVGRFTYIGDPRFTSINDNGSHDWILEIKDVGLNDSTGYECQVSTDPKMSSIVNLHVKAAKAKIRQGEQYYSPLGSSIEFTCEIVSQRYSAPSSGSSPQQTYWYHNGNLLNYAEARQNLDKNFTIVWDPATQISRIKLFNVQASDAGNYTCKPTSAEPTTIRLHVKRYNKNGMKDYRAHHANGYHSTAGSKEAQRNRQYYGTDGSGGSMELADSSAISQSIYGGYTMYLFALLSLIAVML